MVMYRVGYENNYVDDYGLASRFDIYDALIEKLACSGTVYV
ncbi:MAG: hypothetical protein ACLUE2_08730 [Bacteroides cellulosilyticus]